MSDRNYSFETKLILMNETYFFLIVEQKDRQPKRIRLQIGYLPLELNAKAKSKLPVEKMIYSIMNSVH